ncbi:hypothetical protein HanHA300_Chr04g0127401 [Helianthus annuus]|nr:hypothetical protein HanHA300_Chr04g0127401 [Helianthus annuus]KAJ0596219.1 hypothetical protein HanHA89_Chr04g0140331 [Helianthus annuus]
MSEHGFRHLISELRVTSVCGHVGLVDARVWVIIPLLLRLRLKLKKMMHMKLHRLYPPLLRVLNLGRSLLFIDLISQSVPIIRPIFLSFSLFVFSGPKDQNPKNKASNPNWSFAIGIEISYKFI